MSGHISQQRVHDLVDGFLTASETQEVEDHLARCPACREAVASTAEVVRASGALPRLATPPTELWGAIQARITQGAAVEEESAQGASPGGDTQGASPEGDAQVVPLPTTGAPSRRRLTFSVPQLAAAAVVVSLLSAGAVWMAMSGGGAGMASGGGPAGGITETGAARTVSSGEASYRSAAAELEQVLAAGRDVLEPETLAAVERSLRIIDEAIEDVEEALRNDSSSELLSRMLVNHQGARLRVLRQAATLVQART